MLKKFITWLVIKFLSKRETFALIVDRWFVESPRGAIELLYHIAYLSDAKSTIVPFDTIAAKKTAEGSLADNVYVATLLSLKKHFINCGDKDCDEAGIKEFFREVVRIKNQSSVLKVRKELIDHVRKNTLYVTEADVTLAAHVLQESYIDPEIIAVFLTAVGV